MNERIGYRLFREDNRFNACHTCHRWNMKSTASPDDKEDFNLEPTMTDTSNGWYSHFKDSFSSVHMLKIRLTLSIHYVWSNCSKLKILLCFEYRLTRNSLFFFLVYWQREFMKGYKSYWKILKHQFSLDHVTIMGHKRLKRCWIS